MGFANNIVHLCGDTHTNDDGDYVVCTNLQGHGGLHSDGDETWANADPPVMVRLVTYAVPIDGDHDDPDYWRRCVGTGIANTYNDELVDIDNVEELFS